MATEKQNNINFGVIEIDGKLYPLKYLCIDWFIMSNDDFFKKHGINFNPHKYPGLYEWGRKEIYNVTE